MLPYQSSSQKKLNQPLGFVIRSNSCPVIPYNLHRDSVDKRQVCDTVQQYETLCSYRGTLLH